MHYSKHSNNQKLYQKLNFLIFDTEAIELAVHFLAIYFTYFIICLKKRKQFECFNECFTLHENKKNNHETNMAVRLIFKHLTLLTHFQNIFVLYKFFYPQYVA